jgi:hypothetical protein
MKGRKLRIDRVVGAVVVVGLIAGGSWWAIDEHGDEEESPTPAVVEEVLPQPEPPLAELEGLGKEIEGVSEEVSSLKEDVKDIKKKFSPAPVVEVSSDLPPPQVQEEDTMAALGRTLHDLADFTVLLLPEIQETIRNMASAAAGALSQEEVAPPPSPAEEEQGFLEKLVSPLGGEKGGGLLSQICDTCIPLVQGVLPI